MPKRKDDLRTAFKRVEESLLEVRALLDAHVLSAMATMAQHSGYRVEMRTREQNHIMAPHVHVVKGTGRTRKDYPYDLNEGIWPEGRPRSTAFVTWFTEWVIRNRSQLLRNWRILVVRQPGAAVYPLE